MIPKVCITLPNDIMLGEVRDLLAEGRPVIMACKGVSMLPFIVGGRDSVRLVRRAEVKTGDIALAKVAGDRWVLHRVIGTGNGRVLLMGDGNLRGTEGCPLSEVAGVVTEIISPRGETEPGEAGQQRRWRRWKKAPYLFRRVYLAVLHRTIAKKYKI